MDILFLSQPLGEVTKKRSKRHLPLIFWEDGNGSIIDLEF